jgi:phage terminase small subunit
MASKGAAGGRGNWAANGGKKKPAKKQKVATPSKTERRVAKFVSEYIIDFNGRRAATAAGYSADSARQQASEMLADPAISAMVDAAIAERAQVSSITAKAVVDRLHLIATADARELSEIHRACCRYCWGKGHLFQRTPREMAEARAEHAAAVSGKEHVSAFNEAGGIGYNPKKDPNPKCPECFGDGEVRVVLKDTRDLSPAARLLFAGVKQTQHGIEIKQHSQTDALQNLGRHLGVFKDKVELTGKDGGPVEHSLREIIDGIEGADTGIGPASSRKE